MIGCKTTTVPLKSPVAPTTAVANENQQVNEVSINVSNAIMITTPNLQSLQSSAGVVRSKSTESLSLWRQNESELSSKYSLERSHGSHEARVCKSS